jgi:hypothetical protein
VKTKQEQGDTPLNIFTFQIEDDLFAELKEACKTMGITPEEGLEKAVERDLDINDYDAHPTPEARRLLAMITAEAEKAKTEDKARIKEERKDLIRRIK